MSKMIIMEERHQLPDINRLSILLAMILLAYAMMPFVNLPRQTISFQLPGFFFQFNLDYTTLMSIFTAALAAAGIEWLIQDHPRLVSQTSMTHWLLPALTSWTIGIPLSTIAVSLEWWVVFSLGGLLLGLVFVSEYIVVDPNDARHTLASAGLTAISYALILVLAIAMRAAGLRLYMILPPLVAAVGAMTLRSLYLRVNEKWLLGWGAGIALVIGQLAVGLHYLPLSPLKYGLILLGATYGLTSFAGAWEEGGRGIWSWVEPVVMTSLLWSVGFFFVK